MAVYDDALNMWQQKKPPVRRLPGQAPALAPTAPAAAAAQPAAAPIMPAQKPMAPPVKRPTYPQGQGTRNIQPGVAQAPQATANFTPPRPDNMQTRGWMDDLFGGDGLGDAQDEMQQGMQDYMKGAQESLAGKTINRGPLDMPEYMPDWLQDLWDQTQAGAKGELGDTTGLDLSAVTPEDLPVLAGDFKTQGSPTPEDILQEIMEGGEASFDPQREAIESGMHDQLARLAEQMASMGMGTSGIEAALGGQVVSDAARLEAERYQEWYQQQVENKMAAAGMLMQDDWKQMDMDHQEAMARLMFELDRKRELGDQWESGMGDADIRILMQLLSNPEISDTGRNIIEKYMRELMGDEAYEDYIKHGGAGDWFEDPYEGWNVDPENLR